MKQPLFRPEVLEAKRRSWLGGISLAQPLPHWLLAGFAVLAVTAILLFLMFGEYTRRSRVVGQLVPDLGLATVVAPVSGVLTRQMPDQGTRVREGQPLAVISVPRATTSDGDMAAALQAGLTQRLSGLQQGYQSRQALLEAQTAGYRRRRETLRKELAQIQTGVAIRRKQVALAQQTLDRFSKLAAQQYVSQVQLKQQQQVVLEQTAALQALQREAIVVHRNQTRVEQALREVPAQRALQAATHMREVAQLERERLRTEASGQVLVQAPVNGMIASRLVERGQSVQAGQPLLSLLPAGSRLQARLMVPSRAIGFIEPGDAVVLRYQAFPHQKFGHYDGTVIRVSRNALSPAGLGVLVGNAQGGEPYYRVLVALSSQSVTAYGQPEPLRPGMLVQADILGERRKLYEWVLEPLYSLAGRMGV